MTTLIDAIELDILESTGDIDHAERVGTAVRHAINEAIDTIAMLIGLGSDFTTEFHACLGSCPTD